MCLSSANVFVNDMSAGSGFMAFAANQFGQWSPVGGYLATLLFGVMQALRMRLQSFGIATQLTQMLPYLAALIGIKLTGMRMRAPGGQWHPPIPIRSPLPVCAGKAPGNHSRKDRRHEYYISRMQIYSAPEGL